MRNECPVVDCSGQPDQQKNARLPSCNLRSTGPRSRDSVGRKMCALQIPELNCTYIDIVIVSRAAADARLRDVVDGHRWPRGWRLASTSNGSRSHRGGRCSHRRHDRLADAGSCDHQFVALRWRSADHPRRTAACSAAHWSRWHRRPLHADAVRHRCWHRQRTCSTNTQHHLKNQLRFLYVVHTEVCQMNIRVLFGHSTMPSWLKTLSTGALESWMANVRHTANIRLSYAALLRIQKSTGSKSQSPSIFGSKARP